MKGQDEIEFTDADYEREAEANELLKTMDIIGSITNFSEYAQIVSGTHSVTTTYGKLDDKYFAVIDEKDDYGDTPLMTFKEVDYNTIVNRFVEAVRHKDIKENIFSGCIDYIITDGVKWQIRNPDLQRDVNSASKQRDTKER